MICHETVGDYCDHKSVYIWVSVFVLIPICWIRNLGYLAYVSLFSLVVLIFGSTLSLAADVLSSGDFDLLGAGDPRARPDAREEP